MKRILTVAALLVWGAAFSSAQDSRGKVTGVNGSPRKIQLNLRIEF